jgi:putative RecB family exonuclease
MSKTWIDKQGLHINDDELKKKMERVTASATLVSGMIDGCPAKTIFDSRLKDEIFPNGPDSPLLRGTVFHRVMELYYGLPEDKRGSELNTGIINAAARKAIKEEPLINNDHDFMIWLRGALDDYVKLDDAYTKVDIAPYIDDWGHHKQGLELAVSDVIGNASRKTFGKIDRLVFADRTDNSVIIDDYKTGKKAKEYNAKDRFADFGYVRQQVMYAMLLEQDTRTFKDGFNVTGGRLIYPIPGKVLSVDVKNEEYRKRTVKEVEQASAMLDDAADNNAYACSPSKLCSWCPLVNICPNADNDSRDKFVQARAKQPNEGFLKTVVEKA